MMLALAARVARNVECPMQASSPIVGRPSYCALATIAAPL
jgi:hypothetical protein